MKNHFKLTRTILCMTCLLAFIHAHGQSGGVVKTTRVAPLGFVSFSPASVLVGIDDNNHVDGYVKKYGSTLFTFPVGNNGVYRPFATEADEVFGAFFFADPNTTTLPDGSAFPTTSKDNSIGLVSSKEFWDINGTNSTRVTLTWNATSSIGSLTANNLNKLTIAGWNTGASRWEPIASTVDVTSITGGASSLSAGSITTNLSIIPDSYSVFTLAGLVTDPLPVSLINFTAQSDDAERVLLNWATTAESNSKQFDIQHSVDGKSWNNKGIVGAKGESSELVSYNFMDSTPSTGQNLYRLKMLDQDRSFTYSMIRSVSLAGSSQISIYPNPVSNLMFVRMQDFAQVKELNLYNLFGSLMYKSQSVTASGIDVKNLETGTYLVKMLLSNGKTESHKVIITN